MRQVESDNLLYPRNSAPFGKSWENWASLWCKWLLSIPKDRNPAIDTTGKYCAQDQINEEVWFLAGTFGNNTPIRRKCTIPHSKAILFSILDKEDSFAEDLDITNEAELAFRATNSMDRITHLETHVDGTKLKNLEKYRVLSDFFDLVFPDNNVYDIAPQTTRSICDGYWIFLKPLPIGSHEIKFSGEVYLPRDDSVSNWMKQNSIYRSILHDISINFRFRVKVTYDITIV